MSCLDIDTIRKVFPDRFKPAEQNILTENNIDDKGLPFCMERTIIIPERRQKQIKIALYRFDPDVDDIFPYLKQNNDGGLKGLRKICDYILFAEENDTLFVFLVELKRGDMCPKEQLIASEYFVKHIISSIERVQKTTYRNIQIRKIGIKHNDGKRKRSRFAYNTDSFLQYYGERHFRLIDLMSAKVDD